MSVQYFMYSTIQLGLYISQTRLLCLEGDTEKYILILEAMQELAARGKKIIQEIPASETPLPASDAAFLGLQLQDSLPFTASASSLSIVQQFKEGIEQKRHAQALKRQTFNATLNDHRCSETPLIGKDIVTAVIIPRSALLIGTLFWVMSVTYCFFLRGSAGDDTAPMLFTASKLLTPYRSSASLSNVFLPVSLDFKITLSLTLRLALQTI